MTRLCASIASRVPHKQAPSEAVGRLGLQPVLVDMADYKLRRLKDEQDLLIVTSTHGEGDPPLSGKVTFCGADQRPPDPRLLG